MICAEEKIISMKNKKKIQREKREKEEMKLHVVRTSIFYNSHLHKETPGKRIRSLLFFK